MKLKLLFALLVFQVSFAQHRTCGMQQKMLQIMNNPAQRQAYFEQQSKFTAELQKIVTNKNGNSVNTVIRIPVAVHFPAVATTSALKACFRTLAQSQVNILNADYNGTNADISNYVADAPFYPGTNTGNLQVQFVLATQNHPAGTGLVNGDLAVTFGTDFLGTNDDDTTWSGYLNLVCRNAGNGILGYSNLGGSPLAGNCVVIAKAAFGSGSGCTGYVPGSPYDLGRTLTHELGHYFNLDHTFAGCGESNCAVYNANNPNGDGICDTPAQDVEDYDCPAAGDVVGCTGDYALTMNYMDYVNDACMYMFTANQATRMLAWYNAIANQFKTNVLGNESFLQNDFSIYPNPSKGSFTIQFKDMMNSYSVEVYDVTGKTIYENNYDQSSNLAQVVNLDNATSGVYFVNIKSDKGIVTKKLVIE
ncbi:zinc-dependent metalloprotease [Flavobacterium sp.]|uniref:zinc-dependent metalloprotease n=1 Tax=Flavobacterium sp. TaxID=239 RepID=UPI0025D3EBE4|nr:zinc-dependent metalloprotease [Flavobacterium sp.]